MNENLSSNSSDSESEHLELKLFWWSKDDGAVKAEVTLMRKATLLHCQKCSEYIFKKRKQNAS